MVATNSSVITAERIRYLFDYDPEAEAAQAYQEACIKYHGEFACPI